MLFKVFAKKELAALFAAFAPNKIVGPRQEGVDKNGAPIFAFAELADFSELRLEAGVTHSSGKRFFLPARETLSTFQIAGKEWRQGIDYNIHEPYVFFGLHPCDINALNKLDKVLLGGEYPSPYYASKRRNFFIIGSDCQPQPHCFCRSMGTDTVLHGFDMFLTDLGERYFVTIASAAAFDYLRAIAIEEPSAEDHNRYKEVSAARNNKFTTQVDTTDLTQILDLEFQSEVWKTWGDKCLSCGACAMVCPTCYCYGVEERVNLNLQGAEKSKQNYSCNLIDFAEVAGGHNFRPAASTRLKYRYYHKHRGFVEAFEESLCVGCGRCSRACLAGITVPEVIASVRG